MSTPVYDEVNMSQWSSLLWTLFHVFAATFPKLASDVTPDIANRFNNWFQATIANLPCETCRIDATQYERSHPFRNALVDRASISQYFLDFHNYVNQKIGRPKWTMDMLAKHYKLPIIEQKQQMAQQKHSVIGPRLAAARGRIPVQRPAQIPKPAQIETKQSVQQTVLQNVNLVKQRAEQKQAKDAEIVKNAQNAQVAQIAQNSKPVQSLHVIAQQKSQPPVQVPKPGLFIRPFVKRN